MKSLKTVAILLIVFAVCLSFCCCSTDSSKVGETATEPLETTTRNAVVAIESLAVTKAQNFSEETAYRFAGKDCGYEPETWDGIYLIDYDNNTSPFKPSEIRRGDVLLSINGVRTKTLDEFNTELAKHASGETLSIDVLRIDIAKGEVSRFTGELTI